METKKVYTTKNIIVSVLTLLSGIALLFASSVGGATLILTGVCLLIFYRTGWKIEGQEGVFQKETLTMSREEKKAITQYITGESSSLILDPKARSGGLILEVFTSGERHFVQLFDFENYSYTNVCELTSADSQKVENLRKASPDNKN